MANSIAAIDELIFKLLTGGQSIKLSNAPNNDQAKIPSQVRKLATGFC
jgi:hypothetical protein